MRREEMELDYLAPFFAQIGNPETLNALQARKMKDDCLADLKQRLIDKANLIQARFEKVASFLSVSSWMWIRGCFVNRRRPCWRRSSSGTKSSSWS